MALLIGRSVDGTIELQPEGLAALQDAKKEIKIVIQVHSLTTEDIRVTIEECADFSLCILDISGFLLGSGKDDATVKVITVQLFSLASMILVENNATQSPFPFAELSFLESFLPFFEGNLSKLKLTFEFNPILMIQNNVVQKDQKISLEVALKSESGFSSETASRNQLRSLLKSLFHNVDIVNCDVSESSKNKCYLNDVVMEKCLSLGKVSFSCLKLTGKVYMDYLQSVISHCITTGGLTTIEEKESIVRQILEQVEQQAFQLYQNQVANAFSASSTAPPSSSSLSPGGFKSPLAQPLSPISSTSGASDLSNDMIYHDMYMNARLKALQYHECVLFGWTQVSSGSRKTLQHRIRIDYKVKMKRKQQALLVSLTSMLDDMRASSASKDNTKAVDGGAVTVTVTVPTPTPTRTPVVSPEKPKSSYSISSPPTTLSSSSSSTTTVVYNEMLSLKSILHKVYVQFSKSALPIAQQCLMQEGNPYNDMYLVEDVYHTYITDQLDDVLSNADIWVKNFSVNVEQMQKSLIDLRTKKTNLQTELTQIEEKIVQERVDWKLKIDALSEQLVSQRLHQSSVREEKQSNMECLMDSLDRSTRLNEQEKCEMTEELMETQQRIQQAQEKALELRQAREQEANELHRDQLESEREGHKWFRMQFAKQHHLLAEELALERQVNQTKSEQMSELFNMESEHLRNLEEIRAAGQREVQTVRDEFFKAREVKAKNHDDELAMLREQSLELETKFLSLTDGLQVKQQQQQQQQQQDLQQEEVENKPCVVM